MKLTFQGSFDDLKLVVHMACPGGLWKSGDQIREYYTPEGPKIRCWPSGTVSVQGKADPASAIFERLYRIAANLAYAKPGIHLRFGEPLY